MIKFIDLFAGVGGFHYGLVNASASSRKQQGLSEESKGSTSNNPSEMALQQFTCVYSNEWDKYANSVYKKHFGQCDDRDIRTVQASELPDFDLLCGGFPCQSFSVAGKRGGFSDTRGTLFFEIARIVKEKRPRLLFLENVKGLLNHEEGRTFGVILSALDELGYDVQWQVLNSKNFGVPQNRERVYIVGHLRGTARPEVFPITRINSKTLKQIIGGSQGMRVYDPELSCTIASQAGGLGAKTGLYAVPVLTPDRVEKRQNGRRFKTDGEPSFTLTSQDIHGVMVNRKEGVKKKTDISNTLSASDYRGLNRNQDQTAVVDGVQIRRLTPIECERLQGFPDDWTRFGVKDVPHGFNIVQRGDHFGFGCGIITQEDIPISDTQRYKMMGNAVTTNVITAIGEAIIQSLTTLE